MRALHTMMTSCHGVVMACSARRYLNTLQWRHNERYSVSNHQPHDCLLNRLFGRRSKKTSKLRVTGLCAGNSPGTGGFSAQMASNAENVAIWWRHHDNALGITGPSWWESFGPPHKPPVMRNSCVFSLARKGCLTRIELLVIWRASTLMHNEVRDEITFPFSNFNDSSVEVWE